MAFSICHFTNRDDINKRGGYMPRLRKMGNLPDYSIVEKNVMKLMIDKDLNRKSLSDATLIDYKTLCSRLNGHGHQFNVRELISIARAFGVPVSVLFEGIL